VNIAGFSCCRTVVVLRWPDVGPMLTAAMNSPDSSQQFLPFHRSLFALQCSFELCEQDTFH
jgi:hypothetical protein